MAEEKEKQCEVCNEKYMSDNDYNYGRCQSCKDKGYMDRADLLNATMSKEELQTKQIELEGQEKEHNLKIHAEEQKVKTSKAYVGYKQKYEQLDKDINKLSRKERERENEIAQEFISCRIDDGWASPTWSTTYGHNIHDEVIDAIKKTFDWKKLTGGNVEEMVSKMIRERTDDDKKLDKIKDQKTSKRNQQSTIYDKKKSLWDDNKTVETLRNKRYAISSEISHVKRALANREILKPESSSTEMKKLDSGAKRRALEEYREKAIYGFKEVMKVLDEGDE